MTGATNDIFTPNKIIPSYVSQLNFSVDMQINSIIFLFTFTLALFAIICKFFSKKIIICEL